MFVSSDNSKWNIMLASELCQIPIWNGNRTIDENHITRIESDISSLKHLNLNPYRVAIIEEDGQQQKFIICFYDNDRMSRSCHSSRSI